MFELESPVKEIFDFLVPNYFDPRNGHCNWGHDGEHLKRVLAARKTYWPAIIKDEPDLAGNELVVDLALVLHDLDRSRDLRGRTDEAKARREDLARSLMNQHGVADDVIEQVFAVLDKKFLKTGDPEKPALSRIVDDLDKADMGATGIYRMAAVACDRNYGIFARARDFDPHAPAIEGDENLDSFAADICFCLEWYTNPKFLIDTPAIFVAVRDRFAFMRDFLSQLEREHKKLGLI